MVSTMVVVVEVVLVTTRNPGGPSPDGTGGPYAGGDNGST